MVVVAVSVYILFLAVRGTVDVVRRSHVGCVEGSLGFRVVFFSGVFGMAVDVAVFLIGT
jgi:hypothetical protein